MLEPVKSEDNMFGCSQCPYEAAWAFQLNHHVQSKHRIVSEALLFYSVCEPEQFVCICCNYKSPYRYFSYEHYKKVHQRWDENYEQNWFFEKYSCDYCKITSDSSLFLIKHHDSCKTVLKDLAAGVGADSDRCVAMATDDERPIRSTRAKHKSKCMKSSTHLSKRAVNREIWRFPCDQCSYRAKRRGHLKMHLLQHAADEEIDWFQCDECTYRAKRASCLKIHVLVKHATEEEINNWYQCDRCSYRVKLKAQLKRHIYLRHASREEINWHQCDRCSYQAKTPGDLRKHMLQHAPAEEINWLSCDHCPYRGKRKVNLKRHMLKHAAASEMDNWFQCSQCPYRIKYKSEMKKHMLKHATNEEINWLECSHCPYRAKHKSHLTRHISRQHATILVE